MNASSANTYKTSFKRVVSRGTCDKIFKLNVN